MVEMRVRIEDELDVFDTEAKRADVLLDERRRLRQRAVKQNQSRIRRDQHRGEARGANIMRVTKNAERLVWLVPLGTVETRDRRVRNEARGCLRREKHRQSD